MIDLPAEIIVTASLVDGPRATSPATVSLVDPARVDRLGEPSVLPLLRAIPSLAVASSGPSGSLSEVRIRGAEANHTLLVIDGIVANDPAAGNTPRFELLNADLFQRLEVVRGPQSAIWGSEAIGGVVSVAGAPQPGERLAAEAGSFGQRRAALSLARSGDKGRFALSVAGQRARGIDSFDGHGDRDGFANIGGRLTAAYDVMPSTSLSFAGFVLAARNEYDGYDPSTFLHADTLDESRNRLAAARVAIDHQSGPVMLSGGLSLLSSSNRNLLADDPVNRTRARRLSADLLAHWRFDAIGGKQRLSLAARSGTEHFRADDTAYGGLTDQSRSRANRSLTAEWHGEWSALIADAAVRRDLFNRFHDKTSLRFGVVAPLTRRLSLTASYGEGIAQPTFFDLYGFFPGNFAGNDALRPEQSRGVEAGVRVEGETWRLGLTAYRQRLKGEIVDVFDPVTFLSSAANGEGTSRRRGVEAEGQWQPLPALRLFATAAWLDASEPDLAAGLQRRETRRPRWSGSVGADGGSGRWSWGVLASRTGERIDTDFDQWPAARVRLAPYWLAGGRLAYQVHDKVQLFARVANAFDARYQDVVGYRTEGRSIHAGVRLGD